MYHLIIYKKFYLIKKKYEIIINNNNIYENIYNKRYVKYFI